MVSADVQKKIKKHFGPIANDVLRPNDLSTILRDHRVAWHALNVSTSELTDFLLDASLLRRAEFASVNYRSIIRYVRGNPSPYRLGLSLRADPYLSHSTALVLHGLEKASKTIYVNQEQSPKSPPEGMSQAGIASAFRNQQRRSHYVFRHEAHHYMLLSGKNSGRAGVVRMRTPEKEIVDSTDFERTLIDIVVRPAYAGGITRVAEIYKAAARKANIDHLIELLTSIGHAYPYQQSIGFLLEQAGQSEKVLMKLEGLRSEFDFFLDYGLKQPLYDKRWRLYYPESLSREP